MERTATLKDFQVGNTLVDSENNRFTLTSKYDEGIWEARGEAGSKCIFESETKFYTIEDNHTFHPQHNDKNYCMICSLSIGVHEYC